MAIFPRRGLTFQMGALLLASDLSFQDGRLLPVFSAPRNPSLHFLLRNLALYSHNNSESPQFGGGCLRLLGLEWMPQGCWCVCAFA